jgi:hydrogenase maturation protease
VGRLLVAGIGNVWLADDGFGVEVVQRLKADPIPEGVDLADFGIRGVHLAFELTDGRYDGAILVDAVSRGGTPGTVYVIEPDPDQASPGLDAHSLAPEAVLAWVRQIGGRCPRVLIVGCEAESIEEGLGLTPTVSAAVDEAVRVVHSLIHQFTHSPIAGTESCA